MVHHHVFGSTLRKIANLGVTLVSNASKYVSFTKACGQWHASCGPCVAVLGFGSSPLARSNRCRQTRLVQMFSIGRDELIQENTIPFGDERRQLPCSYNQSGFPLAWSALRCVMSHMVRLVPLARNAVCQVVGKKD